MKSPHPHNLPVTNIPRCVSCNAKTLGLYQLQLPDVAAGSGPPDQTCIIHHRMDELLVEQHTVSDRQAASPVTEGAKYAQSLTCPLSHLVDVCRPGKLSIKGHPKIPRCCFTMYWLSEKLHCSVLLHVSHGRNKEHGSAL
jgi:hypothetical protein